LPDVGQRHGSRADVKRSAGDRLGEGGSSARISRVLTEPGALATI
jgi:hypothetical protein